MKTKKLSFWLLVVIVFPLSAQRTLSVSVKPGAEINPDMYGVFFEDINFGADGGLYAELVKNRSFEFDIPLWGGLRSEKFRSRPKIRLLIGIRIMCVLPRKAHTNEPDYRMKDSSRV